MHFFFVLGCYEYKELKVNNKKDDSDQLAILLSEKQPDTITFSKSIFMILTDNLPSDYLVTKQKSDNLLIPYSIIKTAKEAKKENVKEIILMASERPDKITHVRSTLELWGLSSYIDYLYTTGELCFLEGLTPIFEGGFLSASEIKYFSEILAFLKIIIPSSNLKHYEEKYGKDYAKKYLEIRLKMFEWTGKLNVPVIGGIIIGNNTTDPETKRSIDKICDFNAQYNNVHSITFQSQMLIKDGHTTKKSDNQLIKAIKYFQSKNSNISLSVSPIHMHNIEEFLDAGVTDFGSIAINPTTIFPKIEPINFEEIESILDKKGFKFQQRLPIMYDYIKNGCYSKKLGQVFDSYKYKIKKYEQEKIKQ